MTSMDYEDGDRKDLKRKASSQNLGGGACDSVPNRVCRI